MAETDIELTKRKCKPSDGSEALAETEVRRMLSQIPGWDYRDGVITKTFRFPDHWQTMAFVNAAAWISHREDHHPQITVGYNTCRVDYWTHAIKGISENDFICAAKVDALFAL